MLLVYEIYISARCKVLGHGPQNALDANRAFLSHADMRAGFLILRISLEVDKLLFCDIEM
jgi:hypothetical protein